MEFTRQETLQIMEGLKGYKQSVDDRHTLLCCRLFNNRIKVSEDGIARLHKEINEIEAKIAEVDTLIDTINAKLLEE